MAEKNINGTTYRTTPLPAPVALPLYLDVIAVAGPLAGRLPAIAAALLDDAQDSAAVADALVLDAASAVITTAGSERITDIVRRALDAVDIMRPSGYGKCDFEGDFSGDSAADLFPVVKWALREQFYGFFPASAGTGPLASIRKALLS